MFAHAILLLVSVWFGVYFSEFTLYSDKTQLSNFSLYTTLLLILKGNRENVCYFFFNYSDLYVQVVFVIGQAIFIIMTKKTLEKLGNLVFRKRVLYLYRKGSHWEYNGAFKIPHEVCIALSFYEVCNKISRGCKSYLFQT